MLKDQPTGRNVEHVISQYVIQLLLNLVGLSLIRSNLIRLRELYVNIVFADLRFALDRDVEGRIWNKHHKIIEQYRNILNQVRKR